MFFTSTDCKILRRALDELTSWLSDNAKIHLARLGISQAGRQPPDWTELDDEINNVRAFLSEEASEGKQITDEWLPLLKRGLIILRRREANRIHRYQQQTHHTAVLAELDAELAAIDKFIDQGWFRETPPRKTPKVT